MGKKRLKIKLVFIILPTRLLIYLPGFFLCSHRVFFFNLQKNGYFCLSILKISVKFTQHKVSHLKVNRSGDLVAKHFHYLKETWYPLNSYSPFQPLHPWLLPICFLHLWIYPFWLLHISRIIQYVTF